MASVPAGAKVEKPSFAMIAAAGLKPPSVPQKSNRTDTPQKNDITSSPRDGASIVSPSNNPNQPAVTPKQKKIVALVPARTKETDIAGQNGPQVHVQNVDSISPPDKAPQALDGMLMPGSSDEAGTQLSSSSGSAKPPSLDGKSVTSGTTFALDEKESLRPDDSASVKARDDEDVFAPPALGLADSQAGSDPNIMAFRDQFREIPDLEHPTPSMLPPTFAPGSHPPQGVLYIPPQGPGVGTVPGRAVHPVDQVTELAPDPKLLEALDSPKDRIMVLKLEQDIVDFVKDPKESSLKLPQTNAFYRMLAHRLADYYLLGHAVDESTTSVRIYKTSQCRLPPPLTGIATPSTAASTPPPAGPQMKILRRGAENSGPTIANGSNVTSKTTSENGESGNDEDKKQKVPTTREEREARYEAARKRIMGSAKPTDSPEEVVQDISRSSSVADKKGGRKKQRADSDDDFEARSAYTAYYPPVTPSGTAPTSYGYAHVADPQVASYSPANYGNHGGSYPQYPAQPSHGWANQAFHQSYAASPWPQHQQTGYELSGDFQRAMSFQQPPMPNQNANLQPTFNAQHTPQMGVVPQPYQSQNPYTPSYPTQTMPAYAQAYPNRPQSAANQFQDVAQPYAYGQLPSQTFPGRPPSKLEHPLPGSYKGKHFNPHSQAFIPAQPSGLSAMPMQPQAAPLHQVTSYGTGYGMATPPPRQGSAQSQHAAFVSPQPSASAPAPPRLSQPMTHPLPQPVFPQQPSPNLPLPAKPEATPPKPTDRSMATPAIVNSSLPPAAITNSSIAKWGTNSLPPKPPPPAETFDATKFAQAQRQAPVGPNRGMPNFGAMPPAMSGGLGLSAQGVQAPAARR